VTSREERPKLQRVGSIAMVLLALVATVATSQARGRVERSAVGPTFTLSPDRPLARATVSVWASEETLADAGEGAVTFDVAQVWSAGERGAAVAMDVVKTSGEPLDTAVSTTSCFGTDACTGTYEVTFRWPDGMPDGWVRVSWSARLFLEMGSSPLDDAGLTISSGSASGSRTTVGPPIQVALGSVRAATLGAFEIRADHFPPDAASPRLELVGLDPASTRPARVHVEILEAEGPRRLTPGRPIEIDLPARCGDEPCSLPISYQAWGEGRAAAASVTLRVTVPDAAPDLELRGLDAPRVPAIRAVAALDALVNHGRLSTSSASVTIPASSGGDARGAVFGEIAFDGAQASWSSARAVAIVTFPGAGGATVRHVFTSLEINQGARVHFPFALRCELEGGCSADLAIELRVTGGDERRTFRPMLTVGLGFPRSGRVPPDARLELEVSS